MTHIRLDFPGHIDIDGRPDWLILIHTTKSFTTEQEIPDVFHGLEVISPAESPTGRYTEQYTHAAIELDGDGTIGGQVYSTTTYGAMVLREVAERLGVTVTVLDESSSASSQHFIDTGRYLAPGEGEGA